MTCAALCGPQPLPRPPTRSRPHWNSSQHSLTRLMRATRGPSFPPAPASTRASTRRAARRPGQWRAPRRGGERPPPLCPLSPSSSPADPRGQAQPLSRGRLSHFSPRMRKPPMGTPCAPTRPLLLSMPPRDLCLHLLRRLALLLTLFQPKPPFQKGSVKFQKWRRQPPLRGQAQGLLGAVVGQKASSQLQPGVGEVGPSGGWSTQV